MVFSGLFVLVALVPIAYVVRYRNTFLCQLPRLPTEVYGRYFLLGFGACAAAQVLGELLAMVSESEAAPD